MDGTVEKMAVMAEVDRCCRNGWLLWRMVDTGYGICLSWRFLEREEGD